MEKEVYKAIATLIGCVIGAGILSIPYVVAKAGFLTGLAVILVIGVAILLINLYLGEVVLRTKGIHQLSGYAEKYLGKVGKHLMAFSMFFGIYGALLAYIIGVGVAASAIFGGSAILYSLIFFSIMALLVYFGLKVLGEFEVCMISAGLFVITLIIIFNILNLDLGNLAVFNLGKIFLPYGVVLFAFLGTASIPEMGVILKKNKKMLKKAVLIGSFIPLIVYVLFAFSVVGVTGKATTEIASVGLGQMLGYRMVIFGNLFAIFAMSTSFLALGIALKDMFYYDYKVNRHYAWILTCFLPLAAFLWGLKSFIKTIDWSGSITGGITGVLIVLMAWKALETGDRKPEYNVVRGKLLGTLLILIFVIGLIYQLLNI